MTIQYSKVTNLIPVRQSLRRSLDASGLLVTNEYSVKWIDILQAVDASENRWLILRPKSWAFSWPSAHLMLAKLENPPQLLRISGEVLIATADTEAASALLQESPKALREARAREIFLEDRGFSKTNLSKRFEMKYLLGPVLAIIATLSLAIILPGSQEPTKVSKAPTKCNTEINPLKLARFLSEEITNTSDLQRFGKLKVSYKKASVEVTAGQQIGGLTSLDVSLSCPAGETKTMKYRYDLVNGGLLTAIQVSD